MSSALLSLRKSRTKIAVGAVLASGALLCTPLIGASAANPQPAATSDAPHNPSVMPTVVLLHGAWADSGAWDGVVKRLQHDGYPVIAPPNALRGLAIDSADLSDLLQTVSGPIVLVGHSYGGAVISDAAVGNPNVEALVYIDAFIPKKGESVATLAGQRPGSCLGGGGDPSKVFNLVPYPGAPSGDFDLYAKASADDPYPGFAQCFANDLPANVGAALAATQRPITLFGLNEPSGPIAWKTIPAWALVGTEDNVLPPAEQIFMAKRAHATIVKVAASHLSMISHPAAVTAIIVAATQG